MFIDSYKPGHNAPRSEIGKYRGGIIFLAHRGYKSAWSGACLREHDARNSIYYSSICTAVHFIILLCYFEIKVVDGSHTVQLGFIAKSAIRLTVKSSSRRVTGVHVSASWTQHPPHLDTLTHGGQKKVFGFTASGGISTGVSRGRQPSNSATVRDETPTCVIVLYNIIVVENTTSKSFELMKVIGKLQLRQVCIRNTNRLGLLTAENWQSEDCLQQNKVAHKN